MTTIGELNERVSLRRMSLAPDGAGGQTETWAEYAAVWARVRPMKGQERQNAQRQEAAADYVVTLRYRDDVLEADKIVWRGRDLNVRFISNAGVRSEFMDVEAELGAAS